MATKKAPSTALTLWEKEMGEAAVAQGSRATVTGGFKSISTKSGVLSIDDNPVDDNELRVIVLAFMYENKMYEAKYDPKTPSTPVCYAFGTGEKGEVMKPHEEAPTPQHDNCKDCQFNQWGSADTGRGKACGNVARLLCITEDSMEDAETLIDSEARLLSVPVMSVRNWATYLLSSLEPLKRPSWGVITRIKVVPDIKSQFKITFKFEGLVDFNDALYSAMKKKVKEAETTIVNPYPVLEVEEKPAPRTAGKKVVAVPGPRGKVVAAPAAGVRKAKY